MRQAGADRSGSARLGNLQRSGRGLARGRGSPEPYRVSVKPNLWQEPLGLVWLWKDWLVVVATQGGALKEAAEGYLTEVPKTIPSSWRGAMMKALEEHSDVCNVDQAIEQHLIAHRWDSIVSRHSHGIDVLSLPMQRRSMPPEFLNYEAIDH